MDANMGKKMVVRLSLLLGGIRLAAEAGACRSEMGEVKGFKGG